MEDDFKKNDNGRRPQFSLKNQNDDLKKKGGRPQLKMKKMEDDLKKNKKWKMT